MIQTLLFGKGTTKKIAILIPNRDFHEDQIHQHYITPLKKLGIPKEDILIVTLELNDQDVAPVKLIQEKMKSIGPILEKFKVSRALVCQSAYFKYLTKMQKVEVNYGYPVKSPLLPDIMMFASIAPSTLFTKPSYQQFLNLSLKAVQYHIAGKANMFATSVLKNIQYPETLSDITDALSSLYKYPALSLDIETYDLRVNKAGIGSVAFAWNETSGISFTLFCPKTYNQVRQMLKFFLKHYKGKLIYHNASFDIKVLIWELFMQDRGDIRGMLEGLDILFKDMDDTKILSYLATNSTTGNDLSLKQQAFEYAGNYAIEEIKDITRLSPAELMEYNLIDGVCTWYVYNKHRGTVQSEQEDVYQKLFKPALKIITQMELVGVPLNMGKVLTTQKTLQDVVNTLSDAIQNNSIIKGFNDVLREDMAVQRNKVLKKLRKTAADFPDLVFNSGSPKQMRMLLFEHLELPVQGTTHTGLSSTDDHTLQRLLVHPDVQPLTPVVELLTDIAELSKATKILDTFIPAFIHNSMQYQGWHYLLGSFNLGGTVSGRLSSSNPNLMNIPSTGTQYAKLIKECFQVPKGWIFAGADFTSLEDRISALQTKDPEKLKMYVDGYDGHCLRAFAYFHGQMSDIELAMEKADVSEHPNIINSIAQKYPDLRQKSKSPTFALTYQGTWRTLVKNFGFSEVEAKSIEANYHKLYEVSDKWVWDKIVEAADRGYVELAFGLKLRTPTLPKTMLGNLKNLPYQARKEIKTAGNALGQSYGLLNTRALNEFMSRVWASKWREKILPIMQIHDSLYFMISDNIECLEWTNNNLIECMEWNKLDEIQHPVVGLEAELEVFHPTWAESAHIPNKADQRTIKKCVSELILDTKHK